MKLEFARKWVRALRSGKYKQCQYMLEHIRKPRSSYCCLGVLCKITKAPRIIHPARPGVFKPVLYGDINAKDDLEEAVLPCSVIEKTGMRTQDGWLGIVKINAKKHKYYSVATLNDTFGYTFDEIADCIDAMIYGGIINEL